MGATFTNVSKEVILAVDHKDAIKSLSKEAEQVAKSSNQVHNLASAPTPEVHKEG